MQIVALAHAVLVGVLGLGGMYIRSAMMQLPNRRLLLRTDIIHLEIDTARAATAPPEDSLIV